MKEYAIRIEPEGERRSRVYLTGSIRGNAYQELETVFNKAVADGVLHFAVDLGGVEEFSSAVFGVFLQTLALLRPMNGSMKFVNPRGLTGRVLHMLSLDCEPAALA